jgi:hypothetical protein
MPPKPANSTLTDADSAFLIQCLQHGSSSIVVSLHRLLHSFSTPFFVYPSKHSPPQNVHDLIVQSTLTSTSENRHMPISRTLTSYCTRIPPSSPSPPIPTHISLTLPISSQLTSSHYPHFPPPSIPTPSDPLACSPTMPSPTQTPTYAPN